MAPASCKSSWALWWNPDEVMLTFAANSDVLLYFVSIFIPPFGV